MTDMDSRFRERLQDLASDAPRGEVLPPTLVSRARRRIALTMTVVLVSVAIAVGTVVGVRGLTRSTPRPAHVPSKDLFGQIHGEILYTSGFSSGYLAVAPSSPDTVSLELPGRGSPIGWSADGEHLLVRGSGRGGSAADLAVVSADGSRQPITHDGALWGSFAPDASSVVYDDGSGLHVIELATGAVRTLVRADHREFIWGPAWSPDASQIVFFDSSKGGNRWTIQVVNADGSRRRVLVDLSDRRIAEPGPLEWSPDGSQLAFFLDPTKYHAAIWVMDADGSHLRQLTDHTDNVWPTWSPDGTQIAFVRHSKLFVMAADGSGKQQIAGIAPGWAIAWNPA